MVTGKEAKVEKLLSLGVSDVIVKKDLKEKLLSGKKLRIKLGIDPTGFDLHLGHMVVVHKLKEFQDLGHQIILLFGNFTGQIGDPSGKNETRPMRTQQELEDNAKHYINQVSGLLDVTKLEIRWNAEWLAPLNFNDVVQLASQFTVSQMLERDMFQERIKNSQAISIHELMYPLMQGYDSVALKADVELGGTDQTFNLLAGRVLQKAYGQDPQNILTVPILVGTDGVKKMGKTTGNYIGVNANPNDMYGMLMSIPDSLILNYFELAARADSAKINEISQRLDNGENPRNIKMDLARSIVELYHGAKQADLSQAEFIRVFQNGKLPEEISLIKLTIPDWNIVELCSELGLCNTMSEGRRLIAAGGLKVDDEKIEDHSLRIKLSNKPILLQAGKRKFVKVSL